MKPSRYVGQITQYNRHDVLAEFKATTIRTLVEGMVLYIKSRINRLDIYLWTAYDVSRDYKQIKQGIVRSRTLPVSTTLPEGFTVVWESEV